MAAQTAAAGELASHAARIPASLGAYVHIPFCAHRCGYCDFASVAGQDDRADAYLDALDAEMASILQRPRLVRTIFIGGGTPTYVSPTQLARLLDCVVHWFPPDEVVEFTVEANPNTLTAEKARILADHGVDRVSLGAQSFEPALLKNLERDHDPDSVARAIDLLLPRIRRVSIDLIFGIPGQTLAVWERDIDRMLGLPIEHCSAYGLTYEKGTRLWRQRQLGVVQPLDEELERAMYEAVIDRLTAAGWDHYEISNFARPEPAHDRSRGKATEEPIPQGRGNRSRHNLLYWANLPAFGFGTGAAAYVGGRRTLNTRNLDAYIERCLAGRSPVSQEETLEPEARARETAFVGLRRLDGIDRAAFLAQTGFSLDSLLGDALGQFVELGYLEDDGRRIRLTRSGLPVADGVIQSVL